MARSTFEVLFYVNGSKKKNGIVPIMGQATKAIFLLYIYQSSFFAESTV